MRIPSLLVCLGAATLSLSAFADPSIAPSSAAANAALHQTAAPSGHRLSRDEALHMRGGFLLDDGRVVTITNEGSKLFADLDGKREELVQTGTTRFVARDTGARLAFNRVPYADEVVVDQAAR